jgi:hypothetical protein
MRRTLLVILILAFGILEAEARRRGHHHHYRSYDVERYEPAAMPRARYRSPTVGYGAGPRERAESPRPRQDDAGRLVPPSWQLQPPDPNWSGRRYLSPDGTASVAFYSAAADQEPIAAHMKAVAFADGEEVNYLRAEREWIVVSGLKGERIFYRKAALACGGKSWHHVAFEYPVAAKRSMDGLVTFVSRALDDYENSGCDAPVSSR